MTFVDWQISRIERKPGDVFVLHVDAILNAEQFETLRKRLDDALPGAKVLILQRGMRLGVVSIAEVAA